MFTIQITITNQQIRECIAAHTNTLIATGKICLDKCVKVDAKHVSLDEDGDGAIINIGLPSSDFGSKDFITLVR